MTPWPKLTLLLLSTLTFNTVEALTLPDAVVKEPTLVCLQSPSRTAPCPNLIVRSHSLKTSNYNKTNKLVCFCKLDFDNMLNKNVNKTQAIYNKMQWRQILADTNLTEQQLLNLVKR